jgi:hypothetical protein
MARASISAGGTRPSFEEIVADVDEINAASVRVLRGKFGFEPESQSTKRRSATCSPRPLRLSAGLNRAAARLCSGIGQSGGAGAVQRSCAWRSGDAWASNFRFQPTVPRSLVRQLNRRWTARDYAKRPEMGGEAM